MNKIPTAEEVRFNYRYKENRRLTGSLSTSQEKEMMIEFAKLHVEAALEIASNNASILENGKNIGNNYTWDAYNASNKDIEYCIDKESITKAYPLENIK